MTDEDDYGKALAVRLKNRDWPQFENPEFLDSLDDLAEAAIAKSTLEGDLAALLIIHQLGEAAAKVLLDCARFFIQLRLYPAEIRFNDRRNPMAGYWIDQLESTIDFDGKAEFLRSIRSLNHLRNSVFHGITQHASIDDLRSKITPMAEHFKDLMAYFDTAYDWFMLAFKDVRKDEEWWEEFENRDE